MDNIIFTPESKQLKHALLLGDRAARRVPTQRGFDTHDHAASGALNTPRWMSDRNAAKVSWIPAANGMFP